MHLMQTLMPWPEFSCWPTYWNSMRRLWWFCCFNFFSLVLQIPVICIYGTTDSTQCWMAPALTGQFSSSFIQALHAAWLRCNPECLVCRHWQHTRHSATQPRSIQCLSLQFLRNSKLQHLVYQDKASLLFSTRFIDARFINKFLSIAACKRFIVYG